MRKAIFLFCFFVISFCGYSQFRKVVSNDNQAWYVNPKMIKVEGNIMTALVKVVPNEKTRLNLIRSFKKAYPAKAKQYNLYSYSFTIYEFNCNAKEQRLIRTVELDKNNKEIQITEIRNADWQPILNRSMVEGLSTALCNSYN